jgi:hypothetical protein
VGLRDDVRRLQDRTIGGRPQDTEERKAHHVAVQRARHNHGKPEIVWRLRGTIRHTAKTLLPTFGPWPPSTEALIERVMNWQPPMGDLTRTLVEREVAYAIWTGAEGTQDMLCDPEWRSRFETGRETCVLLEALPDRELAEIAHGGLDEDEVSARLARHGITEEKIGHALGAWDLEGIPEDVALWWLDEYWQPVYAGEKGWRVSRLGAGLRKPA